MSDFVKNIAALFPGPVNTAAYMRRSRLEVVFPFYHAVSNRQLDHLHFLYSVPTVKQFRNDMEYLLKLFTPVKMGDYIAGKVKQDGDRPPMVLSFDDGLVQCYDEVMPVLLEMGIPATFFINNAFIDNKAMFYRFKVNLLLGHLPEVSDAGKKRAADLLHCKPGEIKSRLLSVSYVEREITDQVAQQWDFSFDHYMRMNPIYLSSIQIIKLLEVGFEVGSHGIDHPLFSLLKKDVTLAHIKESVNGLKKMYNLDYGYFAFPFTDTGVEDSTIDQLFRQKIIDAGFGTAGLKDDKWKYYFQRVPMEQFNADARKVLRSELNRRRLRKLSGNNMTKR